MNKPADYKATLLLPKTEFPMQAKLADREPKTIAWWKEEKIFDRLVSQNRKAGGKPFVLHDGPPYANGHIHLGHVLNKVLKDIIVKHRNMGGQPTDYIPGWDCHGLPIELQVVKSLGKKRHEMSLSAFRNECRQYAESFIAIQREEFQRLGILGHFETPYLTMKFSYQASIIREFAKIAQDGYIFRDKKPIHWCISCGTALAEAEIEYAEHVSPSIYVNFPLDQSLDKIVPDWKGKHPGLLIWTTTPWTLPANLAICLHPEFEYALIDTQKFGPLIVAEGLFESVMKILNEEGAKIRAKVKGRELEGLTYQSILNGRQGKVILGTYVTLEQGTGCVHTAPGHGHDDYINGLKYGLEVYAPVDNYGKYLPEVKQFAGFNVFDANTRITEYLKAEKYLLAESKLAHSYPHCWRCKKPVIFRATPQWFFSMDHHDLRKQALAEIEKVKWVPHWGRERIYGMIENRPDWCLSRQRSWGVPIPAVYCESCNEAYLDKTLLENLAKRVEEKGANCWYEDDARSFLPSEYACANCKGKSFRKEKDILDVWFDSGVSFAAVGNEFPSVTFPVDLYLEGSDQHRGWFHSALLTSVATRKRAPYRAVLTHGFVVDGERKKMSKSAGNYVSAQDAVKKYGAEILRLWVAAEDYRDDIRISEEIMQRLAEAYRKIRNTQRYLLGTLYDFNPDSDQVPVAKLTQIDRFILDRLDRLVERVGKAYEDYEFHVIYHALYNFCTIELSSFYLDILKDRLYVEQPQSHARRSSQTALWLIARKFCALMAPILSVTAEEVWSHLPNWQGKAASVFLEPLPNCVTEHRHEDVYSSFNRFLELREEVSKALELARKEKLIGQSLEAKVILQDSKEIRERVETQKNDLPFLFIVSQVEWVAQDPQGEIQFTSEVIKGLKIAITKAKYSKCARCWNYREGIGKDEKFPDVCPRCSAVLHQLQ